LRRVDDPDYATNRLVVTPAGSRPSDCAAAHDPRLQRLLEERIDRVDQRLLGDQTFMRDELMVEPRRAG
jgi:hypothetical protein